MISFSGVTKRFGRAQVLDALAFEAHPGQVTLLVGANGSGKTTSLRLLAGLSRADAGEVRIGGADVRREADAALGQLSFLPQSPRFHPRLTAGEILRFYARLRGLDAGRVDLVEARWHLQDVRDQPTARLSGGTRQRLALAVLALPDAPVLVLDEPGLSLDPDWRRFLHAELHAAARRGATVLVATHLLGEWDGKTDRCLVLERGQVSRELPPTRLREAFPFTPTLAQAV